MAQLSNVRFRALDANNAIVSGAGLFIYEEGSTSTFASIYTDPGLTTPASNPLTSYTNGYFPQFYIAEGLTVDIYARQTTSVGSTLLWQALSVDSVGNEAVDTFFRDFGVNGRVQIVGAGGLVRMEFMDPTGDDVGGDAVVSGANGTDLTSYEHRGPMHITGALTVDGAISTAPTLIAAGTASAVSNLDLELPAGYDSYRIELRYIGQSAASYLSARLAFDTTPTFKSGASDYAAIHWTVGGGGFALAGGEATSSSEMVLTEGVGAANASTLGSNAQLEVISKAGRETTITGKLNQIDGGTLRLYAYQIFARTKDKNYGKATWLRLFASSGTLTAEYAVYGVPTSL